MFSASGQERRSVGGSEMPHRPYRMAIPGLPHVRLRCETPDAAQCAFADGSKQATSRGALLPTAAAAHGCRKSIDLVLNSRQAKQPSIHELGEPAYLITVAASGRLSSTELRIYYLRSAVM